MRTHNTFASEVTELEASGAVPARFADDASDAPRGEDDGGRSIEFLSNLAHQLRSPLSSLRVWVDLMSDPKVLARPRDMKRLLEGIDRATSRLERQVKDVLEAGYLEAGTLTIETSPVDVNDQLVAAVADAEHAARSRRISIDLRFAERSSLVVAGGDRLRQIVGYLLSNAIRFSPVDGTVIITSGPEPKIADLAESTTVLEPRYEGPANYICVSDDGPGVPVEQHREVFRTFQRAVRKDAHGGGGSGLGLSIASGLMRLLQGGIWLRSDTGEGAEFEIGLPAAGVEAVERMRASEPDRVELN